MVGLASGACIMATGWNAPQGVEMCIGLHCVAGKPEFAALSFRFSLHALNDDYLVKMYLCVLSCYNLSSLGDV